MNRRRFVFVAGLMAATPVAVTRAQTAPVAGECSIGFINGLLQYAPDCPLLTPPGLDVEIAPPSHLAMPVIDEAAADAAIQEAETEAQERLTAKRNKKDEKMNRRGDRQREKRRRGTERQQRKREGRRDRRDNGNAVLAATPTP